MLSEAILEAQDEEDNFDVVKVKNACTKFITTLLKKNEAVCLVTSPFTIN